MSQARMVNMAFMTAALLLWVVSAEFFSGSLDLIRPEWDLRIIGNEFRLHDLRIWSPLLCQLSYRPSVTCVIP